MSMRTFKIIWSILYAGVWFWTINGFIYGILDWFEYLFPVMIMTFTNPWFYQKKKK